jgi:Terminase large subunit, T4likevirus-type, N-terminal
MSIASDLARAIDPAMLGADCGLALDKWQSDLLRSDAQRILLCCSRQAGKSTVAALVGISTAISTPGSLTLLVSPSQRQSSELFRTLMALFRKLPDAPEVKTESVLKVELANGSRVIALPGDERTTRGYAGADLVVIDEAARCDDSLLAAIRPTMATKSGARLIALSTPAGKRGFFYDAWHGDPSWHRVRVPATECPRISAAFLAEELRELGQQRYDEEYGLQFLDDGAQIIRTEFFDRAVSDEVSRLWPNT